MKSFLRQLATFILFFFLFFTLLEIFILPKEKFYFRSWEYLAVNNFKQYLTGPYYPNQKVIKVEQGDLMHHSPIGIDKNISWITDQNGFRTETKSKNVQVVIIGDSSSVGTGSTQEDILEYQLERETGLESYTFAPREFNDYISSTFMQELSPRVILFQITERSLKDLAGLKIEKRKEPITPPIGPQLLTKVLIFIDSISKRPFYHFMKTHYFQKYKPRGIKKGEEYFLQGKKSFEWKTEKFVKDVASSVKKISDYLKEKRVRFIFIPSPNKETLYDELFNEKDDFLLRLSRELNKLKVNNVNTLKLFRDEKRKGKRVFHKDDSHWNPHGISLVAKEAARLTREF